MMTKREVVKLALEGKRPPYVPCSFGFTHEAQAKLVAHFGVEDLEPLLQNHLLWLGNAIGFFEDIGHDQLRDVFGVVWDRSVDKDIGIVANCLLPEPTFAGYQFPDPLANRFLTTSPLNLTGSVTGFGRSRSAFRCMNGRGRCAGWKT